MSKITKETLIPIGLVLSIASLSYSVGKSSNKLESVENRVQAIESDRYQKLGDYNKFQLEVLQRLTRIETAVTKKGD